MRIVLLAAAALVATPAAAQDHSAHGQMDHGQHQPAPSPAPTPVPAPAEDHAQHGAMDHSNHGAMDHSQMDHAAMGHAMDMDLDVPTGPPPARAFEGPQHAAELYFDPQQLAQARQDSRVAHGGTAFGTLMVERLEAFSVHGEEGYLWDVTGWYGTGTDKIVFKSEGEDEFGGGVEEAEAQLLWGHAIGPFIDLQLGMRVDAEPDTRAHAVVGVAGLAPYNIHFDAAAFVDNHGDVTARIEAEHDMRLTQRLILQPRVELELAAQDSAARAQGSGLTEVAVGARLRYEIVREFAPYLGVEYVAATGGTADYLRAAGDDPDGLAVIAGLRFWF